MKTMKRITLLMAIMSFFTFQGISQTSSNPATQKGILGTQNTVKTIPGKFVDANKDGICDNRNSVGQRKANCTGCGNGYQHRYGQGKGNCCGYGCGKQYRHGRSNNSTPVAQPKNPINN
jgi:hypothetical protein